MYAIKQKLRLITKLKKNASDRIFYKNDSHIHKRSWRNNYLLIKMQQ